MIDMKEVEELGKILAKYRQMSRRCRRKWNYIIVAIAFFKDRLYLHCKAITSLYRRAYPYEFNSNLGKPKNPEWFHLFYKMWKKLEHYTAFQKGRFARNYCHSSYVSTRSGKNRNKIIGLWMESPEMAQYC